MPDMAALYVAHHGWLQAWLRRRLGDAHQAADLAQDTFVRLLSPVAGGTALPPLTGMSKEIGIKGALLDGKLNTSFALFQTQQDNAAQFSAGEYAWAYVVPYAA